MNWEGSEGKSKEKWKIYSPTHFTYLFIDEQWASHCAMQAENWKFYEKSSGENGEKAKNDERDNRTCEWINRTRISSLSPFLSSILFLRYFPHSLNPHRVLVMCSSGISGSWASNFELFRRNSKSSLFWLDMYHSCDVNSDALLWCSVWRIKMEK